MNVGGALVPRPNFPKKPHSENLRLNRLVERPATFFVTKSLHPKKPILDPGARELIVSALEFSIRRKRICLRAFVIMPDHWHALFALREPWTLPKFMHGMMSFIAAKTSPLLKAHQISWQEDGYYDTRVKTAKQFAFSRITLNKIRSVEGWSINRRNGRRAAQTGPIWFVRRGLGLLVKNKKVAA